MALQQFVAKGVDLRETQLKKALSEMDKFEDALLGTCQDDYEKDVEKLVKTIEEDAKKGSLAERFVPKVRSSHFC